MSEKIAIMADSACDIPQELIDRFKIRILPLKVIYGDKVYRDRIDIQPDYVYSKMPEQIPTTSMPNVQEIKDMIEGIKNEGFTHLLSISISSKLSGTYETIRMVAEDVEGIVVKAIDSRTLTMGTGYLILDAAKNISHGLSFDKVLEKVKDLQSRVKVFYILETLEYLRRGGRIGRVAGMLGEFLHFKPVISVAKDGSYFTYAKVRGRNKSLAKLVEIVEQAAREKPIKLAVMDGGAKKEAEKVLEHLRKLPNVKEVIFSDITPTLGVHTGPGLVGVCFYDI